MKLIDVYPEDAVRRRLETEDGPAPGELPSHSMATSYRSRWKCAAAAINESYENPEPLMRTSRRSSRFRCAITTTSSLKGHRLMVQVQSTWFPVIDRNPQKFVPSIYLAKAADFVPATQRIFCTPAMPSHLVLPVVP